MTGEPNLGATIGVSLMLIQLGAAFVFMLFMVGLAWLINSTVHVYRALTFFVNGECPECKKREDV